MPEAAPVTRMRVPTDVIDRVVAEPGELRVLPQLLEQKLEAVGHILLQQVLIDSLQIFLDRMPEGRLFPFVLHLFQHAHASTPLHITEPNALHGVWFRR